MMQCSDKPVLLKAFNVFYLQTRSVDFIVLGVFFIYLPESSNNIFLQIITKLNQEEGVFKHCVVC